MLFVRLREMTEKNDKQTNSAALIAAFIVLCIGITVIVSFLWFQWLDTPLRIVVIGLSGGLCLSVVAGILFERNKCSTDTGFSLPGELPSKRKREAASLLLMILGILIALGALTYFGRFMI